MEKDTASEDLEFTSRRIKGMLVKLSHDGEAAHLGGSLSCVDIMTVLYWKILKINPAAPEDPNRDRLIFSKGHAATTLYTTLAYKGFFDKKLLSTFAQNKSKLAEHPSPHGVPGIEAATGSLGHGLPIGCGLALAAKLQNKNYRTYILMSDGECNEGSNWEAALFASAKKLDNLTAIIDYNKWQATGRSNEVLGLPPLAKKWAAFGWHTLEINGHDLKEIESALRTRSDKPVMIIANTIKGQGISFMEDDNNWHYRIPTEDEIKKSLDELGLKESDL